MVQRFRSFLPLLLAITACAQSNVIKVGGEVQAKNLITKVTPGYPAAMKVRRLEASVQLAVLINTEGVPVSMSVQDPGGPSDFSDAAIEAVKQWRYKPTLLNGQPVDVMTTVQINFTLAK